MNYKEYREEIKNLATEIIQEYSAGNIDDIHDSVHEYVDGHSWIIYYAQNNEVLNHTDNQYAIEDVYDEEGIGKLFKEGGVQRILQAQAYFAMEADLSQEVHEQSEAAELEVY